MGGATESSVDSNLASRRKSSGLSAGDAELLSITVPPSVTQSSKQAKVIDVDELSDEFTPLVARNLQTIDISAVFGDDGADYDKMWFGNPKLDRLEEPAPRKKNESKAPEQTITIFALRLAMIEKAASGIGTLSFVWATVVILGGFASTVSPLDFWVVTVIIVAESSRILSRSHELEWQSLSSKSLTSLGRPLLSSLSGRSISYSRSVYRKLKENLRGQRQNPRKTGPSAAKRTSPGTVGPEQQGPFTSPGYTSESVKALEPQNRTWSKPTLPILPLSWNLATVQVISHVLFVVQLFSAILSIGLSLWRLEQRPGHQGTESISLNVFYVLSVVEAGLFLLGRSYWEFNIRYKNILDKVRDEADLGVENLDTIKHFYYDVYAQCLRGSVFDGLEMDLVSYSISWLQSEYSKQQLGGAKLLNGLVSKKRKPRPGTFAENALRRLGTTPGIIERLVEMLSWDTTLEAELLLEIATIICRLVVYNRNCSRLLAIPGSMDAVESLLLSQGSAYPNHADDVYSEPPFEIWLTGLRILKYLCQYHKSSMKIGETRGLLSILVIFIEVRDESSFERSEYSTDAYHKNRMKIYKRSLQVLGSLAASTNTTGHILRARIATMVSSLKYLRDIIEYGDDRPELQRLAVGVLYYLAMEEDLRKMIGATGGMIRNLFKVFTKFDSVRESATPATESPTDKSLTEECRQAAERAGETLTRLILQNKQNCLKMSGLTDPTSGKSFYQLMVDSLSKTDKIGSSAAQILRSVMVLTDESSRVELARQIAPVVLIQIMRRGSTPKSELYEACLGLGSRVLGALDNEGYREILGQVNKIEFVKQLLKNLKHTPTTNLFPSIRRYSVELILALISKDDSFLNSFQSRIGDLQLVLEETLDSISEVENFCLFSGLLGYTRHQENMDSLVQRAIEAVDNYKTRSLV